MKITGHKKAVGQYREFNNGYNGFSRGEIMLDRSDGKVWTDFLGNNEWKEYHSKSIINLGSYMAERSINVNMKNVKEIAEKLCSEWEANNG